MDEALNEQIVLALFAALGHGDREGIRCLLNEDAVWSVMAQGIRNAGDHCGRDAIVDDFLSNAFERFVEGGPRIIPDLTLSLGHLVVMEAHSDSPLRNGNHYRNRFAWFFTLHNQRIQTVHEYCDTRYALEAFGAVTPTQ